MGPGEIDSATQSLCLPSKAELRSLSTLWKGEEGSSSSGGSTKKAGSFGVQCLQPAKYYDVTILPQAPLLTPCTYPS